MRFIAINKNCLQHESISVTSILVTIKRPLTHPKKLSSEPGVGGSNPSGCNHLRLLIHQDPS